MRLQLLGPVELRSNDAQVIDIGPVKRRTVLAALAVDAGRPVAIEALVDRVWDEQTVPASARDAIYTHVSRLRDVLVDESSMRIVRQQGGYVLDALPGTIDLHRFTELTRRAQAPGRDDAERAGLLRDALDGWCGRPLADIGGGWATRIRDWLSRQRIDATLAWAEAELRLGRQAAVLPQLQALAAEEPLAEDLIATLMRVLHGAGRDAEALSWFALTSRRLADELGVDPGAQLRNAHQVVLRSGDPTAVATRTASQPHVPRQLPAGVRHFVGRARELKELAGLLDELDDAVGTGGAVVISAIGGTAGVGKTALALHWAHQVAERFPDGQLYVNLRGFDPADAPVTPEQAIRSFLDALGVPAERLPVDSDGQAGLYRSLLAGKRMLLVLDNARDAAQVRPLLPASPTCLAVVTSRSQLAGLVAAHGARLLSLGVFTDADADALLGRRLGPERIASDPQAAAELSKLCAGLPLALSVIAARAAAHPDFPLAALAAELRDAHRRLDVLDTGDAASSARAVFSWSYRQLSDPAARMFRLLAEHPGPDITAPAAASLAAVPVEQARAQLGELRAGHLLTEHRPGRYAFHDLLRLYAGDECRAAETESSRRAALHRLLDHYLHSACGAELLLDRTRAPLSLAPPRPGTKAEHCTDHQQAMAWFAAEHHVLLAAITQAAALGFDTIAWQLPWALVTFFARRGHGHELVTTQQGALAAARRSDDRTGQAHAHANLGYAYIRLGRHADAHTHLRQALSLFRQLGDHAGQARAHQRLSWLLAEQNRRREALSHEHQALDLHRVTGNPAGQARALNGIGWHHTNLGNHRDAISYCQQALAVLSELDDRDGEAATWDSLGHAHHHLGDHGQAITCYQRALDLIRDLGDRFNESQILVHLGDTQHATGDHNAATDAWQQALAILDDLQHADANQVRAKLEGLSSAETCRSQQSERDQPPVSRHGVPLTESEY